METKGRPDFEVRIKYVPCWRDPNFVRRQMRERRIRAVLGGCTAVCLICLALPDRLQYDQAISVQLAQGGLSARVLFA